MPSLSQKMEMLLESYEQSKRSPAYRELKTKYNALKKAHNEILSILTEMIRQNNVRQNPAKNLRKLRNKYVPVQDDLVEDPVEDPADDLVEDPVEDPVDDLVEDEDDEQPKSLDPSLQECIDEECIREDQVDLAVEDDEFEASPDQEFEDQVEVEEEDQESVDQVEEEVEEVEEEVEDQESVDQVEEEVEEEEVVEIEVEEEVEEEVEDQESVDQVEEEVEEEVEEVEEEEEEEDGVYEIERNGKRYYTTNEQDGVVYSITDDEEVGDEVGKFVNGKLVLHK